MIVSFSSVKGGVGKTVGCVNLAYYVGVIKKHKTLVVDLDCQGGATHNLSAKYKKKFRASLHELLCGKAALKSAIHEYEKGLHFIPGNYNLHKSIETNFAKSFKAFLGKVKSKYDFIFLDLSPAIYEGTSVPLSLSDQVIIPVDCPGGLGLLGLDAAKKQFADIRGINKDLDVLGILPNMVDRTRVSKSVLSYLQETFPNDVFPGIRRNAAIAQSSSLGKTIFEYKKKANGIDDYTALGKEFLRRAK